MYRGHVHIFIFLFICVHTDVRFDPLFCIMAMWHGNFCTTLLLYIYNINQGSNLYIYMVDLILEHDIMVDLVLEHDMCGSCMCANLNEFPILKGRI